MFLKIQKSFNDYKFIYNKEKILQLNANEQPEFMDAVKKKSYKWESLIGFLDLFVFSQCDFVASTFSSNFGRMIYEMMHVNDTNPFLRFKSLDKAYFIHGYTSDLLSRDENLI